MKKEWAPTQEAFDSLLNWLDPDRELAGQKYETIRLRLIKIFACRGCHEAEELADESINRVTAKVEELATTYEGDPLLYFYGVASRVYLEYVRKNRLQSQIPPPPELPETTDDDAYECFDECMGQLPKKTSQLLLRYYQDEKHAKIENRKRLAQELGLGINALRIRAHRMRVQLQKCVESCLDRALAH